jgi:hypothetical protein
MMTFLPRRKIMDSKDKQGKYVWVQDKKGNVFVCKLNDLVDPNHLTDDEKEQCLDTADFDIPGAV